MSPGCQFNKIQDGGLTLFIAEPETGRLGREGYLPRLARGTRPYQRCWNWAGVPRPPTHGESCHDSQKHSSKIEGVPRRT
jgi:hypothetical protein